MTMTAEQRTARARKAGLARAAQFTPEYQRAARAKLPAEAVRRGAKAGFASLVARFGRAGALKKLAAWRLANPSPGEAAFAAALEAAGVPFEREVVIGSAVVDFYIPQTKTIVEIDGGNWHDVEADAKRDRALARKGYQVNRITAGGRGDELAQIIADPALVRRFAGNWSPSGDVEF